MHCFNKKKQKRNIIGIFRYLLRRQEENTLHENTNTMFQKKIQNQTLPLISTLFPKMSCLILLNILGLP